MTDNEHNLSISTNAHTRIDKIRGINQSISEGDDIVTATAAADTNLEAAKNSMKRRHYQRKRKEGTTVEQIPSFLIESDPRIPTPPPSSLHTTTIKSEYDEKELNEMNVTSTSLTQLISEVSASEVSEDKKNSTNGMLRMIRMINEKSFFKSGTLRNIREIVVDKL